MELTPRTLTEEAGESASPETTPARRGRRRRWLPLAVIAIVLVALGILVYKGLSDAALYFRTADEAVAQRDDLGSRRFRLEGTVVGEPTQSGGQVSFAVAYNGVSVDVHHVGDPPDLFRPGIPVVLEGHWADGQQVFDSDRILVKHDEKYESQDEYDQRMREADQRGGPTTTAAGGEATP
jgi:cytochrome c-type biogenesis protein CcmE